MSGGWKPRDTILVEDALIALAEALQPDAGVAAYFSPPFPSAVPPDAHDPLREAFSWWDPFEAPRKTREDIPWLALEEARSSLLQALGDGELVLSVLTGRGDMVEVPREAWRAWNADTHLRFRRHVMPGARDPLTLKADEFQRWLALGLGRGQSSELVQLAQLRQKKRRGPPSDKRMPAKEAMLVDLRKGLTTRDSLLGLSQKKLLARYGAALGITSLGTVNIAREEALSEFVGVSTSTNSDKPQLKNK